MKKTLLALCVAATIVGCSQIPKPTPAPVTPVPSVLRESDNNKLFSVSKGTKLTIELKQGIDASFFWTIDSDKSVGGLTLLSESEEGSSVRFVVQADSPGVLSINYVQFTDLGGKVIKTFLLKVEVK
jgi:predicted secreted protein